MEQTRSRLAYRIGGAEAWIGHVGEHGPRDLAVELGFRRHAVTEPIPIALLPRGFESAFCLSGLSMRERYASRVVGNDADFGDTEPTGYAGTEEALVGVSPGAGYEGFQCTQIVEAREPYDC